MPWGNRNGYPFAAEGVKANAPLQSGVYGLYAGDKWVYFGESGDVRARLAEHLNDPKMTGAATHFSFELVAGQAQRAARQDQLISEFQPPLNKRLG